MERGSAGAIHPPKLGPSHKPKPNQEPMTLLDLLTKHGWGATGGSMVGESSPSMDDGCIDGVPLS